MSQASFAGICIIAYCKERWPDDYIGMSKTVGPDFAHRFQGFCHSGTFKYISDAQEINERIGAEKGSGVWGYARYEDGSRLIYTCYQGLLTIDENGLQHCR